MKQIIICIAVAFTLSACGPDPSEANPVQMQQNEAISVNSSSDSDTEILGQAAYEINCASCHDTGRNGAPVTGEADDWLDRSSLWQAVLFEHAKAGYLEMPAKGGHPELADAMIDAAAEYMLAITHPHIPRD